MTEKKRNRGAECIMAIRASIFFAIQAVVKTLPEYNSYQRRENLAHFGEKAIVTQCPSDS